MTLMWFMLEVAVPCSSLTEETKRSGRSNYALMTVLINTKVAFHLELQCLLELVSLVICWHYFSV
ncbi:hypothetical protein L195_g057875, partial [Trifolium pratense]